MFQSTNFQSCQVNFLSSWVEPVVSRVKGLAQGHNTVTLPAVSLKLATYNALPSHLVEPLCFALPYYGTDQGLGFHQQTIY